MPAPPSDPVDGHRRRWLRAAAWSGIGWPSLSWPDTAAPVPTSPVAIGQPVPWPTLRLLDGSRLCAADLQGIAAVVVLFATTCPFCRRHNQRVEKLVQASRGEPLRVVAAAQDTSAEPVRRYLDEQGFSFPVTLDEAALRRVLTPRKVIPLTAVVDRGGHLREVIPGEMAEDDLLDLARWARR